MKKDNKLKALPKYVKMLASVAVSTKGRGLDPVLRRGHVYRVVGGTPGSYATVLNELGGQTNLTVNTMGRTWKTSKFSKPPVTERRSGRPSKKAVAAKKAASDKATRAMKKSSTYGKEPNKKEPSGKESNFYFYPPKPATLAELTLILDLIEARTEKAIADAAAAHQELFHILRALEEARGKRAVTVHYHEGAPDFGMGPGFYTDEDYKDMQEGG